jgi:hypothetical protein
MTPRIHALFTVARPSALLACGLLLEAFTVEAHQIEASKLVGRDSRNLSGPRARRDALHPPADRAVDARLHVVSRSRSR